MIPNRIFVQSHSFPNVIGGPQRCNDTDVEFIRADKVAEILKNVAGACPMCFDDAEAWYDGFDTAIKEIKKEIEAL